MDKTQLIGVIETTFPILKGCVELTPEGSIIWSVDVSEDGLGLPDGECEKLYDRLYSLEPFFNRLGMSS